MRVEISSAVQFLSNLMRGQKSLTADQLAAFRQALSSRFTASFTDHWFPDRPLRGNAYRCVRIVNKRMDKLVAAAGADAGLSEAYLLAALPQELSVWIDPDEVSYRIGEDGSVGIIYRAVDELNANESRSDDDLESVTSSRSSSSGSTCSSSSPSPVSLPDSSVLRVSPQTVNHAYLLQTQSA
jgi:protein Tob/BTG